MSDHGSARRRRHGLILAAMVGLGVGATQAQSDERFQGRLSVLPVDFATAPTMSGSGEARATLSGGTLVVTGAFEGLSSPATAAHIHQAPPARRGPIAFDLEVTPDVNGTLAGTIELTATDTAVLREHGYYVQIHTEHNRGGELRGWLMARPR